jgi:hypothetical protein
MKKNNTQLRCRSCDAPMFWAETVNGKRIPIDAVPVHDGNIRIIQRPNLIPLAVYQTQIETFKHWPKIASAETYVSHFATCPQRDSWRKRE